MTATPAPATPQGPAALDPVSVVRSKAYISASCSPALLGIPISAIAYGFLALVGWMQDYLFTDLPGDLFDGGTPAWWPVPWLMLCGLLVALTLQLPPRPRRALPGSRLPDGWRRRPWTATCPASSSPPSRRSAWARCSAPRHRSSPSVAASRP